MLASIELAVIVPFGRLVNIVIYGIAIIVFVFVNKHCFGDQVEESYFWLLFESFAVYFVLNVYLEINNWMDYLTNYRKIQVSE